MNNYDFEREIINNCSADYKLFCDFQSMLLEIFEVTHNVLKRNNIKYYAIYGTLLGLYRDKCMIPWDYDFDLMIAFQDAQKTCNILEESLPEEYYVISNFNNKDFPFYQMRVCKKGFSHLLHVDIFYYIPSPNEKNKQKIYISKLKRLFYYRAIKNSKINVYNLKILSIIKTAIKYLVKYFISNKIIDNHIVRLIKSCVLDDSLFVFPLNSLMNKIKHSDLGEPQKLIFDNYEIYVPEKVECVLNSLYKNFREYPPFEVRYNEYQQGLKLLKGNDKNKIINSYRKQ